SGRRGIDHLHRILRTFHQPAPTSGRCPPAPAPVPSRREQSELTDMVRLFYGSASELGRFERVAAESAPKAYRRLLEHNQHMTVAMEAFHRSPVDVRVLEAKASGLHYARRSLLARQSDGRVVQLGIVRLNFAHLGTQVRREIESQSTPLGRILI